jgi:hypothetical protein
MLWYQWLGLGIVVLAVLFLVLTVLARVFENPNIAPWVRIGKPLDRWGDRGSAS